MAFPGRCYLGATGRVTDLAAGAFDTAGFAGEADGACSAYAAKTRATMTADSFASVFM